MFNWYKLTFAAGMLLVVFVLAFYDRPSGGGGGDGKIELKILANPPPGYGNEFAKILAEFEKIHPHIKVKHLNAPGNYYVKLQTMMVGKTCADVVGFSGKQLNSFKAKGTLLNLMPFIRRDRYDLADFFEVGLADAQMTPGELYYLPMEGSGSVLFYNRDLFDKAGLKYPGDDWTWEDFRDAAVALTRDTNGDGRIDQVGYAGGYWWPEMISWIWANGGDFVNPEHTRCLLNRPEAVEALNFLLDLERKYQITARALGGATSAGIYDNFASGRIGMIVSLAYGLPALMEASRNSSMRWGVAMPPKGKAGRPNRYTSSGWIIWSGTRHPEEAWELMKFLCSPEAMKKYCMDNHYVPARKSIGLSKEYLERGDVPYDAGTLIRSLQESRPLDNIYALRSIVYDFHRALDRARLGFSDIQYEMDKLTAAADKALAAEAENPRQTQGEK